MGFQARLAALEPAETYGSMELAAAARYWDGLSLAINDRDRATGAVYLMGYTVEMLLKTAYYRARGLAPTDSVAAHLKGVRSQADWHGCNNFHDLVAWAKFLVAVRANMKSPLDPVMGGAVVTYAAQLQSHWSEALRYRSSVASEVELHDVLRSVEWFQANYSALWS